MSSLFAVQLMTCFTSHLHVECNEGDSYVMVRLVYCTVFGRFPTEWTCHVK